MSTTSRAKHPRERRGLGDRILSPLILALARLPMRALYRVADLAFFIAYRVLRARRRVARENLRSCFPEKSEQELDRIEERCYRNTCDAAVEWLKLLTAPLDEIRARVSVDREIAKQLLEQGRSTIFVLGHCGNWEWAIPAATGAFPGVTFHVVYHPLAIAALDRLACAARARAGALLSTMEEAPRAIVGRRRELSATILVADQRPRRRNAYPTTFFGRETNFLRGPERLARRLEMPVVFVEMVRVARGSYPIHTEWLCADPGATAEGEITERFAHRLEQQIRATPDDWFWFHRRWRDRRAERARSRTGLAPVGSPRMGGFRVAIAVAACAAALACGDSSEPATEPVPDPPEAPAPPEASPPPEAPPVAPRPPAPAPVPAPVPAPPTGPPQAEAPAPAEPEVPAISLEELAERIKQTDAIGTFSKLALKNDIDDLVDALRRYHEKQQGDLEALHARYDALVLKLMTLLERDEPELALALGRSRKAIWSRLVNPIEFAKLPA